MNRKVSEPKIETSPQKEKTPPPKKKEEAVKENVPVTPVKEEKREPIDLAIMGSDNK